MSLILQAKETAIIKGEAQAVSTNLGTPAMIVKSIADYTTAPTLAIDASTGDMTFSIDGAVDPLIDSGTWSGGTSDPGVVDVSDTGYTTLGGVADGINSSGTYQAQLLGSLRDDLSGNTLLTMATGASTDIYTVHGLKVPLDPAVAMRTSVYGQVALAITAAKFSGKNGWRKDSDQGGFINELWYLDCNFTSSWTAATAYIDIYEVDDEAHTDRLIAKLRAAATTVQKTWGTGYAPLIAAQRGMRLVVRPSGDAAITAGYITITGKSYNPDYQVYS